IVLIGSSLSLRWAKQCYLADNTKGYQNALLLTTILTVVFMILQIIGWRQLFNQDFFIASSTLTSYIYVISAMHFMHVIAGLPFLILFYYVARKRMKEPVSVLVYFSDPEKRLKLKLLTTYWNFLDGLWIYLVLFFIVNRLIS
ncbi:MAG: heme-copper oxidase subunit III, partial [Saprospiraceae bacterium]